MLPPNHRYPELDLLRTGAILGMIIYHAAYDLTAFYGWNIDITHGEWKVFERVIAITFLLLVGISFAISYSRTKPEQVWTKFLKRGLIVFGCGLLVSLVTYFLDPPTYVRFGILHLIGLSLILLPFFVLPLLGGVGFDVNISLSSALISQISGLAAVALWAMIGTSMAALIVSTMMPMRGPATDEADGLDIVQHGQQAWDFR